MLSILDTAAKNPDLLAALESEVGITQALMELTEARLAFHVAAELSRQGEGRTGLPDMGGRARQKLRELSKQEKTGELPPKQATKKVVPGSGEREQSRICLACRRKKGASLAEGSAKRPQV
jgi:hypothetical protein